MPEQRTIPTPAEHREFTVKVNNTPLERVHQLLSATVTKVAGKISSARLAYLDGSASAGAFGLSNAATFLPGAEIEILAGASNNLQSLFKGIVIKQSLKARDQSAPQLIIECRHKAVTLTIGRKNASFAGKTDSEAIQSVIDAASLRGTVDTTRVTHQQLVQYYSTDWDFILSRAQANGMWVLTNDEQISVKSPSYQGTAVFNLQFGATLLELDAEMDARLQFSNVKGVSWDAAQQSVVEKDAQDPGTLAPGNVSSTDLAAVAGLDHLRLQQGMIPEAELQSWVNAQWLKSKMSKVGGRLKCEGIATVNPGDIVSLGGVGDRFNGNVLVNGVRQSFDLVDGWKTHLQFGNADSWFGEDQDITAPRAGSLLPAVNGLQTGIVTDNEDPDGEFRVRVRMPLLGSDQEGVWARVASLDAGDQRGFFFRPEVNDEVILGFLEDDPRHPVILGMLHSSAKSFPLSGSNENHEKMYQSRSGMKLYFNDDTMVLRLETPSGKKITMDDQDSRVVSLEDEHGNKIEMNSDGIKIQSVMALELKAGTDLKLEGLNTEMKGTASVKTEASGNLELKSSGTVVIQGGVVQIN